MRCIFDASIVLYSQNLALQRFPVAKWMSINIFVWSTALAAQAACHSFGGLFACRFVSVSSPSLWLLFNIYMSLTESTDFGHVRRLDHSWLFDCHKLLLDTPRAIHSRGLLVPHEWFRHVQNSFFAPAHYILTKYCECIAQIIAGFVSFGILHIPSDRLAPWQWYMIITGIVSLVVAVSYW